MNSTAASTEQAPRAVRRALAKKWFCTLATSSAANRPHAVGVVYAFVDGVLYVSTLDGTRKARNIRAHSATVAPVVSTSSTIAT